MHAGTTYSAIIGGVIKQLREERSLNQGEMAAMMGLTQAAWSKLEAGKSTLNTAQLARCADNLQVEANQILRYADEAKSQAKETGMTVTYDKKEAENTGLMLLGAAAIGALIAVIILGRK